MPWWSNVLEKAVSAVDKTIDNIEHRRAGTDSNQTSTAALGPGASPVPTVSPGEEMSAPTSPLVMGPVPGTDTQSFYANGLGADLTNGMPIHVPSGGTNGQRSFLTPSMDVIPLDGDGRGVFDFEPRDNSSELVQDDDWNSPTVASFPYRPRSVVGTPESSQPASPDNHLRHLFKRQAQRTSSLTRPKALSGLHSSGSIDEISTHARLGGFNRDFRAAPRRHSVNLPRSLSEELNNNTSAQFAAELQTFIKPRNGTPQKVDLGGERSQTGSRGLYKPKSLQQIAPSEDDVLDHEKSHQNGGDEVEGDVSDHGTHSPSWNVGRRNGEDEYSDEDVESEFEEQEPEYEKSQYGDSAAHISEEEDENESEDGEYENAENPDNHMNGETESVAEHSEEEEEIASRNGFYENTEIQGYGNGMEIEPTAQLSGERYDENEENEEFENKRPEYEGFEDDSEGEIQENVDELRNGGDASSVVTEEESEGGVDEEMGSGNGSPTLRERNVAQMMMGGLRVGDLGRDTPDSMKSFGASSPTSALSHFDDEAQPVNEDGITVPASPKTPQPQMSPRNGTPGTSVENLPAISGKPVLGRRLSRPIEDLEPDRRTIQTKEMNNLLFSRIRVLKNDMNSSSDVEVWIEEEVHEKAAKTEGGQPGNSGSKPDENSRSLTDTPENFTFSFEDYGIRSGNLENEVCETDTDRLHKLSQDMGFADPIDFRKKTPTPPHSPTKLHGDRTHVPVLLSGAVETPWGMTGPKYHSVDDISIGKSEKSGVGSPGGLSARRGLVSASLDSFQPLSRTRSDPAQLQKSPSLNSPELRRSWGSSPPPPLRERYANLEFGTPLSPRGSTQSLSGELIAETRISEGEEEEEEEEENGSEGIAEVSENEEDGERSPQSFQSEDSMVTEEEDNLHEESPRNSVDGKADSGVIEEEEEEERFDGDEQRSPMDPQAGHAHGENATPRSEDEENSPVEPEASPQATPNQNPDAKELIENDWLKQRAVPKTVPAIGVAAAAGFAVLANHAEPRSMPTPIGVHSSNADQPKLEPTHSPNMVAQLTSPLVERSAHGVPEEIKPRSMPLEVQKETEDEEGEDGEETDSCDRCCELQNELDSICQHLQDYPSRMVTRRDSTEKSLNDLADKERENYIQELEETLKEYALREGEHKATIDRLDKSMTLLMLDANVDPEKEQVISGLMSDLREAEGRLGLLREEMQVKERDLKDAQSTTELLRKMIGELEKTNQAQAAELANNEAVLASIGGSIAERAVTISEQAAEIKQHQESAASLRAQLQTADSAVAAAQAKEEDLKAKLDAAEEKTKEAAETIESLSVALEKEQERVTSLEQQVEQIKTKLENEVEEGKKLKAAVATSEAALLTQTARLHQAEKDASELKQKLQQKESEIAEVAKASDKQREIDHMVLELKQERARANHLEDEFNRIIPKKNDEIEELRCQNEENVKLVKWGEAIVKDMVAALKEDANRIEKLEGELEEKKKELKAVIADAAENKVTVRRLQDTILSLEQRLSLLQSQSFGRDKEYREFRDLAGRLHNDVSSRSEEIQAMRDRERKYKDTLKVLDEVSQTQSREIAALRKQLNSTLESEHELKVANSRLAAQNDLLKRDQHQAREQAQAMQHEIQHLRQLLLREGVPRHALYSSPPRRTSSPMTTAQSPTNNASIAQ